MVSVEDVERHIKVYAILGNIYEKTRILAYVKCMPGKCSATELLDTSHTTHKSPLSGFELLEHFLNTNQLKGRQSHNEYFINILGRANTISVMYGSAGLLVLSYLSLSRGIVSCIIV